MAKRRWAMLIFFIFLFTDGMVYGEIPYEKGLKEFKEENFEEALEYFLEARKLDPSSSSAAFFLGLTYKHIQNYKDAIPHLRDAVTLTPKIKEALVELIDVLYLTNNLEESKKWIEVGEKEEIAPARIQFLKGLVLAKEGKGKEAISAFEKAKEIDKTFAQAVEFHIANIYVREGKLKEAKERFRFALTIDPTTEMGLFARDYEKFLTAKIEREKPWRLSAGLAYKYDSNVVLKPLSGPLAHIISDEEDHVLNGTLRVGYTAPFSFRTPYSLSFQYSFYTDIYEDLTPYQWISSSISAIPGYNFGKVSVNMPIVYGYNWLKRRSYNVIKGVEPTMRFMVTDNSIGEVSLGYYRKGYLLRAVHPNEDRDGENKSLTFGWNYFFKEGEGLLNIRYSPSKEDTDGRNWEYKQHKFSANLLYPLIGPLKLQLSGDVTFTKYLNENTFFLEKRTDDTYSGSIGLIYSILKNLDAIASYSYTRDISTIEIYNYKRSIFTLGLELRY